MASFALTMALGALGQADELTAVAEETLQRASTSFQTSHMRFWYGGVYARACRLNGRIDECVAIADRLSDSAKDVPGLAYANLASLVESDLANANHVSIFTTGFDSTGGGLVSPEMKQRGLTIGTSAGGAAVMARSALTRALVGLALDLDSKPAARSRTAGR